MHDRWPALLSKCPEYEADPEHHSCLHGGSYHLVWSRHITDDEWRVFSLWVDRAAWDPHNHEWSVEAMARLMHAITADVVVARFEPTRSF